MLLIAAALITMPSPLAQSKNCPRTTSYVAVERGKSVAPRKLSELPPANAYKAVYRRVDGCEVPVIVKYGVGGR